MSNPQSVKGSHSYEYDLIVIGGGSGGIQCARESASHGAKVAVLDFVKPSPQGTAWGLGGTCVNVGCIPKKLMHTAAIIGDRMEDSIDYGWKFFGEEDEYGVTDPAKQKYRESRRANFRWQTLAAHVGDYIRSLNFKYKIELNTKGISYVNALGKFVDEHTVEVTDKKGNTKRMTADKFVIAVGGRPTFPDIPGAKEHCISSDDIFWRQDPEPGKTLVVGASYVALECAGFLTGIGFPTTLMIRSVPLRGFDRKSADKVLDVVKHHGTRVLQPWTPLKVEKDEASGKLRVTMSNVDTNEEAVEEFDTVLLATGRTPETATLGLDKIGVKLSKNGKILVNEDEQSSCPSVYAIGDVREGGLELTPVAIQAGKLLAMRLFAGSKAKMDYLNVPTTVFTPMEYGAVGMSEEQALETYGEDDLVIYYKSYNVLEYQVPHRDEEQAYMKLICVKSLNERVVGFHYVGPNAGEITQAVAVAMRLKATKQDFDDTVGIHPTSAETMTTLQYGQTEDSGC